MGRHIRREKLLVPGMLIIVTLAAALALTYSPQFVFLRTLVRMRLATPLTLESASSAYKQQEAASHRRGRKFYELCSIMSRQRPSLTEEEMLRHLGTPDFVRSDNTSPHREYLYFWDNRDESTDMHEWVVICRIRGGVLDEVLYNDRGGIDFSNWTPPSSQPDRGP
jgi:hypothetical protein